MTFRMMIGLANGGNAAFGLFSENAKQSKRIAS